MKKSNIKQHFNWKRLAIIASIILLLVIVPKLFTSNKDTKKETEVAQEKTKQVDTIVFGKYQNTDHREVLGTIETSGYHEVVAKNSGTIGPIFVDIGHKVKKGEILAKYEKTNDSTQINFENAQSNLLTTKLSTQNSVRSAEIALQTAKAESLQTENTQERTYAQTFELLETKNRTATTAFESVKDYTDRIFGISPKFQYQVSMTDRNIGKNNSLKKQNIRNSAQDIIQDYKIYLGQESFIQNSKEKTLSEAKKIRGFLEDIQTVMNDVSNLIRGTTISSNFPNATKTALQSEADGYLASINGELTSLTSQIEAAESQEESKQLAILNAQNRVKNAEAQLEIAKASAQAQISNAENQVRIAGKSQIDLDVRAPFSGTITDALISQYSTVSPGTVILNMVSDTVIPEIVAYLSPDELKQAQQTEKIEIILPNGDSIKTGTTFASTSLNPTTQKIEIRFWPSKEELGDKKLPVGSFVTVQIPIQGKEEVSKNLPISALSFEPDGAEVFIINEKNIAERRKVITGKIIGDSVEITAGLKNEETIIKYRNRVKTGEAVSPNS